MRHPPMVPSYLLSLLYLFHNLVTHPSNIELAKKETLILILVKKGAIPTIIIVAKTVGIEVTGKDDR